MRFDELGLPVEFVDYLKRKGLVELYPPQEAAVKAGVLEGASMVVSSPTASGKTLIAVMAAFKKSREGRKVVYLAPLRALASEKYAEFSELSEFGLKTSISTGDYDSSGESLGRADIVVLTNERFDSIVRHRASWLRDVGLFIADEIHLAGSDSRGPTLEMILTKIMHAGLDAQILSLSATVSNAEEVASWLNSKSVQLDWRPVPLKQGVYDYGRVIFTDGNERPLTRSNSGPPIDVALDTVKEGGQSLIFASTRRRAVSLATKAAELTKRFLTEQEKLAVAEASRRILGSGEETSLSRLLAEVVAKGAAFHHAGLEHEHRKIVEDYYRVRAIKVLAATPTLCLPEGEEIFGNPGPIAIQKLSANDRVLTHKNAFRRVVTPTSRPYSGQLVKVTPWFQLPMRMTPEHKVLRVVRSRHSVHSRVANRHWWTYSLPEWTESKNLKVGDMVLFPVAKEEVDPECVLLPMKGKLTNQFGVVGEHWTRLVVDRLTLDHQTLEVIGLFIAEGYTGSNGQVMFAINTGEGELTSKLLVWLRSLGLSATVKDFSRHRRVLRTCSKQLAGTFKDLCGDTAVTKRIPHSLFLLPKAKAIALVRGMWLGDGSAPNRRFASARYSTVSSGLAKQLFALLVRIGYMPSIKRDKRAGKETAGALRITHRHDLYTVSISGKQLSRFCREVLLREPVAVKGNRGFNRGHLDSEYYYMPIRKIEHEEYSGKVYNLEVEEHSSYVGSFVVHNSAGVNLPARRVVVADMTRYDVGSGGSSEISVMEYRQMAGRAGRPQYDDHGETVMIPPPSLPPKDILDHYANEPPEPIKSMLAGESAMRVHVLATIATASGLSEMDVKALFGRSLLSLQVGRERVAKLVERAFGYLLAEQLVEVKGGLFYPTDFGRRVSMLYVDPVTGVQFRKAIRAADAASDHAVGVLQLVAGCPDFEPKFPLRSKDYEQALAFVEAHVNELLQRPASRSFAEFEDVLDDMRSVMALHGWINEWREEQLLERLGVEPGDVHRAVDNCVWLLNAFIELAKLFKRPELAREVELLSRRVEAGVASELVELTLLQGVGRVRARALYSAGYRTLEDLKEAPADKLALVEKVGQSIARKIKEQVARY